MKIQRILALLKMELKKVIREPAFLFLMLLFPAVLTVVFGFAFSDPALGLSFNAMARKNTISTCNIAIIIFEMTWLPMKSPEVIGVVFNLFNKPSSLISLKD